VLLSGNLGYRPTIEAAIWFSRRVWPELTRAVPGVRWLLVGARPARVIRNLARLPNVEVHGDVPDVARFLARATVAIAPMTIGSGIPMKVVEAWSAGVPVVADPWAAEGLGHTAAQALAVAASRDEWVVTLRRLLLDQPAAQELGQRGHREWSRRFQRERVFESIREAVSVAAARRRSRTS
jgi:glycosyltransferase involved in cell wall biosynthesis